MRKGKLAVAAVAILLLAGYPQGIRAEYIVVDTGQDKCYDDSVEIPCPQPGEPFYGQDAQYDGIQPAYQDNGDGTVTDSNTGLMWQQTPDFDNKLTWDEAVAGADTFSLAGYDDWRLPAIKELYSLIDFRGSSMAIPLVPYIDTAYFDFEWGDTTQGERLIDAQYWSSTEYVGTTMNGDATAFGVNFADGRIKGYPTETGPFGSPMEQFVRYVRAGDDYGVNDFVDNGDGTITDLATGLMWMKTDSETTINWEQALNYAENLVFAGYDDWRLPNAKELQSIVDYSRAPDAQDPGQQGPAIDPIFHITEEESYFWTGTTLLEASPESGPGSEGIYLAFGQAWGYMGPPPHGQWLNVHGAGAQRSDPKSGDPANWPYGRGPQGDEIRIYNYVRCVRGGVVTEIEINMVPDDPPVVVPRGGFFGFTGTVTNNTDQPQIVDAWTIAVGPRKKIYGPFKQFYDVELAPNDTIVAHFYQHVSYVAPLGFYDYIAYCGDYDWNVIHSSSFHGRVIPAIFSGGEDLGWLLTGSFDKSEQSASIPSEFALLGNYPNPFNASTVIDYQLAAACEVKLEVYNLLGEKVATLVDGEQNAGYRSAAWDASAVSSGLYFYKLTAGDYTETKRMMLVK